MKKELDMGIDYSGGMIVGEIGSKIREPDDYEDGLCNWVYDNEMDTMSLFCEAGTDGQYFGFTVKNVPVAEMDGDWTADVKAKAEKFERLTGVPAKLIGTQDIY